MDLQCDRSQKISRVDRKIGECTACELCHTRTNTVPGEGYLHTPLMFVGEGPGADEDLSGKPFVGRSGDLLGEAMFKSGLSRKQVFITNVVKCRPPGNRNPTNSEMQTCYRFLEQQVDQIKPQLVVTLGKLAAEFILGYPIKITRENGHLHFPDSGDICIMTVLHPAYVLRNQKPEIKESFFQAIEDARNIAYGVPGTANDILFKKGAR